MRHEHAHFHQSDVLPQTSSRAVCERDKSRVFMDPDGGLSNIVLALVFRDPSFRQKTLRLREIPGVTLHTIRVYKYLGLFLMPQQTVREIIIRKYCAVCITQVRNDWQGIAVP